MLSYKYYNNNIFMLHWLFVFIFLQFIYLFFLYYMFVLTEKIYLKLFSLQLIIYNLFCKSIKNPGFLFNLGQCINSKFVNRI